VLESAISSIADGQFYYRGHQATALAATQTLEEVAWLIWTGTLQTSPSTSPDPALSPRWSDVCRSVAELPPFEAFQTLLPLAAWEDLAAYDLRPPAVAQTGLRILRLLAAIAAGEAPLMRAVAETLQRGWVPQAPQAASAFNTALILCADHELNTSAFTARCVASAGSTPYAAVIAGLAALQGVKHGGTTARVEAFFQEAATPRWARAAIADRLRRGEAIPGFGQPLYPESDPRANVLMALASSLRPEAPAVALAHAIIDAARDLIGAYPNIDFGLVTLTQALQLPPGSALALFAIGRTTGWIGQAIEAYQEGRIIRPRARSTGMPPSPQTQS
jgi:citrate synthase